jgi:hypothetical protein
MERPGHHGGEPGDRRAVRIAEFAVQVGFSEPLDANSVTTGAIQLLDTRNVPVPGALTYNAQAITVTFTPAGGAASDANVQSRRRCGASGVKDLAGNALGAA